MKTKRHFKVQFQQNRQWTKPVMYDARDVCLSLVNAYSLTALEVERIFSLEPGREATFRELAIRVTRVN